MLYKTNMTQTTAVTSTATTGKAGTTTIKTKQCSIENCEK